MNSATGIRASVFQYTKDFAVLPVSATVHISQYHNYLFSKYFFGPGNWEVVFKCEELYVLKWMKILKSTEESLF